MKVPKNYARQIERMASAVTAWYSTHPGAHPEITFNWEPHIWLVSPISRAIANGFIICNADGLALLKSLGSWENKNEPTANMVRIAFDLHFERKRRSSTPLPRR